MDKNKKLKLTREKVKCLRIRTSINTGGSVPQVSMNTSSGQGTGVASYSTSDKGSR